MAQAKTAQALAWQLETVLSREAHSLRAMSESKAQQRPAADTWSPKEELGHLIDSAVNNHVRFVAASLQNEFQGPGYAQDGWVGAHGYQQIPLATLIDLWESHNTLLVAVVQRIPEEKLAVLCKIGDGEAVTLGFLVEDYIVHMQHHLDHLQGREKVTVYPQVGV